MYAARFRTRSAHRFATGDARLIEIDRY